MRYRLLSYPLSCNTPVYPGDQEVKINPVKQMSRGNSCNTYSVSFSNHSGTHIDAPRHFFVSGQSIEQCHIRDFIFERPFILNLRKGPDELVTVRDLKEVKKCDILLVNTGFSRFRKQKKYIFHNPGFSAEAAAFIRGMLSEIRAIGIDTISISCYSDREEGRDAHRILLGKKNKKQGIFLIEDMRLRGNLKGLKKVYAIPLVVKGIDSAPCTIIGEF